MKSYQSIKAQIAKLEKQAEALRANETQGAIAQIKKIMAEFGLSGADLVAVAKATKAAPAKTRAKAAKRGVAVKAKVTVGAAKYRDPKTQKTWTGRGKPPNWIVGVKNRDAFLIDAPAAAAPAAKKASAKAATKAVTKRAAKPAAAPSKPVKPAKKVAKTAGKKAGKPAATAPAAQEAPAQAAA